MMSWIATGAIAIVLIGCVSILLWCGIVAMRNAINYMRAVDELDASIRRCRRGNNDEDSPT